MKKKITDHSHDKYITIPEFNKLTAENFAARLAKTNLITKTDFDNKLINLNKKKYLKQNKTFNSRKWIKKLETFDSIYFRGKSHFEDDDTQNYLVFQTAYRYFKTVSINYSNTGNSNNGNPKDCLMKLLSLLLNPSVNYVGTKARVKFNGNCLRQGKI